MIEEWYSVSIYFVVVFDNNLNVTLCSLLVGGVFRCPNILSFSRFITVKFCHRLFYS